MTSGCGTSRMVVGGSGGQWVGSKGEEGAQGLAVEGDGNEWRQQLLEEGPGKAVPEGLDQNQTQTAIQQNTPEI